MWILKVCTPNGAHTLEKVSLFWSALFRRVSLDLNRFHRSKKYVGGLDQVLPLHHRSVAPGGPSGGARARQGGWLLACRMPSSGPAGRAKISKIMIFESKILIFCIFKIHSYIDPPHRPALWASGNDVFGLPAPPDRCTCVH